MLRPSLTCEMRHLEPGEWVAISAVAYVLAADVVLIRKGHEPVSTCIRRNAHWRRVVRAGAAHLTDTVPGDLLTMAGARFVKRAVDEMAAP